MSKENQQAIKPGMLAFYAGPDGLPQGVVVTKANLVKTSETKWQWRLKERKVKGTHRLTLWVKSDGKAAFEKVSAHDYLIKAKSPDDAREAAAKIVSDWDAARKQSKSNILAAIPPPKLARWLDAWIQAHQSEWPTYFSLPKNAAQAKVDEALKADMLAMGFTTEANLALLKLATKSKSEMSDPDRLNVWLVKNWFHGAKLVDKKPAARLDAVHHAGFPKSISLKALGMRFTRLNLTTRSNH